MRSRKETRQIQASLDRGHLREACPECGKRCYPTRKAARAIAKKMHGDGPRMSAYPCGEYWHVGHTPHQVRQGWQKR